MDVAAFMKMDIFFTVTTVAVVVCALMAFAALFFFVRILRDLSEITRTVRREAVNIAEDLEVVRTDIREGVHEVREGVGDGMTAARSYSKAFAGAGLVNALSNIFKAFAEEKERSHSKKRKKKSV